MGADLTMPAGFRTSAPSDAKAFTGRHVDISDSTSLKSISIYRVR